MNTDKDWRDLFLKWFFVMPMIALLVLLCAPAVIVWLTGMLTLQLLALSLVWILWLPCGISMLAIYSNSPHWQEYFESGLLPLIGSHSKVLNWSERKKWPTSLRKFVFYLFKGERDFNPMILYFRPFCWPKMFRFNQPFKEAKHGKLTRLAQLEAQLSDLLNRPVELSKFHPRSSV